MKQKLLAVLATFVAVTPFVGVKADGIQYTLGSEHNFIVNDQQKAKHEDQSITQAERDSVGVKVIALGEKTEDGYVKALATGAFSWIYNIPTETNTAWDEETYKDLRNYMHMYDDLNANVPSYKKFESTSDIPKEDTFPDIALTADYVKNYNAEDKWVDIMSAQDFLTWMKGSDAVLTAGQTYSLTSQEITKFKMWFAYPLIAVLNNPKMLGFYTKDWDKTTGKIWVVDVVAAADGDVASVTLRQKAISEYVGGTGEVSNGFADDGYVTVPILYFNEKYDCKYEPQVACYKCGEEYQWLTVGSQAATCEAVSSVTSKAKCVKSPKTGVEDYILEFAIAAGICGLVLVAVKRKSLFSRV